MSILQKDLSLELSQHENDRMKIQKFGQLIKQDKYKELAPHELVSTIKDIGDNGIKSIVLCYCRYIKIQFDMNDLKDILRLFTGSCDMYKLQVIKCIVPRLKSDEGYEDLLNFIEEDNFRKSLIIKMFTDEKYRLSIERQDKLPFLSDFIGKDNDHISSNIKVRSDMHKVIIQFTGSRVILNDNVKFKCPVSIDTVTIIPDQYEPYLMIPNRHKNQKYKLKLLHEEKYEYRFISTDVMIYHSGRFMKFAEYETLKKENENDNKSIDTISCFRKVTKEDADKEVSDPNISDQDACRICYERPKDWVIMNCRHRSICATCSIKILESNDNNIKKCPMCRGVINMIVYHKFNVFE